MNLQTLFKLANLFEKCAAPKSIDPLYEELALKLENIAGSEKLRVELGKFWDKYKRFMGSTSKKFQEPLLIEMDKLRKRIEKSPTQHGTDAGLVHKLNITAPEKTSILRDFAKLRQAAHSRMKQHYRAKRLKGNPGEYSVFQSEVESNTPGVRKIPGGGHTGVGEFVDFETATGPTTHLRSKPEKNPEEMTLEELIEASKKDFESSRATD